MCAEHPFAEHRAPNEIWTVDFVSVARLLTNFIAAAQLASRGKAKIAIEGGLMRKLLILFYGVIKSGGLARLSLADPLKRYLTAQ
jgi:hypothetical protein